MAETTNDTGGSAKRSRTAMIAAAAVLAAAGMFAVFGPSADVDHIAAARNGNSDAYGSDSEPATAPPRLTEIDGWLPGAPQAEPTERSCVNAALNDHRPDAAELHTWTAIDGGDATVHLSIGGDPSAVVAQLRTNAATCPPQHIDGVTVHVVGVYPLAGLDAVEIRYGTDAAEMGEIVSVWVANGQILAGATGHAVGDTAWATMLDALATATVEPDDTARSGQYPAGGLVAG